VATDALARREASRLAVLGYGEQAATHIRAILHVRPLTQVRVWGRSAERASAFATEMRGELGIDIAASGDVRSAVTDADIICTVSAAFDPILEGAWVRPGTHINVVGSSYAGPAEIDNALVVGSRFIVDSREGVLAQGGEFRRAREAGLIGDDHIAAEIGEALAGRIAGRQSAEEITVYKSLGHVVQDLASAWALYASPG